MGCNWVLLILIAVFGVALKWCELHANLGYENVMIIEGYAKPFEIKNDSIVCLPFHIKSTIDPNVTIVGKYCLSKNNMNSQNKESQKTLKPAIIYALGLSYVCDVGYVKQISKFAMNDIIGFMFDYRTLGKSHGLPRNLINPNMQIQDLSDVITHIYVMFCVTPNINTPIVFFIFYFFLLFFCFGVSGETF